MKRLLRKGDARKLSPTKLGLNPDIVEQAITTFVNNPTYGGIKKFIVRETLKGYSSYGLISDDYNYIFESYEFINFRQEKWCAIIIAPLAKVLDNTISAADLSVSPFKNEKETYRIGDIEEHLGGVAAADGTIPTFNNKNTDLPVQENTDTPTENTGALESKHVKIGDSNGR